MVILCKCAFRSIHFFVIRHCYELHLLELRGLFTELKGTATQMIRMFKTKSWSLIPVSSNSVEKEGSCGCLNSCKLTVMEEPIL